MLRPNLFLYPCEKSSGLIGAIGTPLCVNPERKFGGTSRPSRVSLGRARQRKQVSKQETHSVFLTEPNKSAQHNPDWQSACNATPHARMHARTHARTAPRVFLGGAIPRPFALPFALMCLRAIPRASLRDGRGRDPNGAPNFIMFAPAMR